MAIFFLPCILHAWKFFKLLKSKNKYNYFLHLQRPPRFSFLSNMTVSNRAIDPDFLDGAAWDNGLCCKRKAEDKIYLLKKIMFILSKSSEGL